MTVDVTKLTNEELINLLLDATVENARRTGHHIFDNYGHREAIVVKYLQENVDSSTTHTPGRHGADFIREGVKWGEIKTMKYRHRKTKPGIQLTDTLGQFDNIGRGIDFTYDEVFFGKFENENLKYLVVVDTDYQKSLIDGLNTLREEKLDEIEKINDEKKQKVLRSRGIYVTLEDVYRFVPSDKVSIKKLF